MYEVSEEFIFLYKILSSLKKEWFWIWIKNKILFQQVKTTQILLEKLKRHLHIFENFIQAIFSF